MSRRLDDLDPAFFPLACQLLARCVEARIPIIITCTGRTDAEQAAAVAAGRSRVKRSLHQDGRAIDLCLVDPYGKPWWPAPIDWRWQTIGRFGEALGLRWGGRFGESEPGKGDGWDAGHLELPRTPTTEV